MSSFFSGMGTDCLAASAVELGMHRVGVTLELPHISVCDNSKDCRALLECIVHDEASIHIVRQREREREETQKERERERREKGGRERKEWCDLLQLHFGRFTSWMTSQAVWYSRPAWQTNLTTRWCVWYNKPSWHRHLFAQNTTICAQSPHRMWTCLDHLVGSGQGQGDVQGTRAKHHHCFGRGRL